MGTRHLICVVKDNDYKVAQYGQWDGYPSGQGVDVLLFLSSEYDKEKFEKGLSLVRFGTDEEINQQWKECGAGDSEWVSMEVSDLHKKKYPENSRDTGSDILKMIQDNTSRKLLLRNSIEFAKDSLFCEWAYIINLDNNTLEVYEGFNQLPLKKQERFFFNGEKLKADYKEEYGYYPIKFVKSYSLDNLPSEKKFLEDLEHEEDQ